MTRVKQLETNESINKIRVELISIVNKIAEIFYYIEKLDIQDKKKKTYHKDCYKSKYYWPKGEKKK